MSDDHMKDIPRRYMYTVVERTLTAWEQYQQSLHELNKVYGPESKAPEYERRYAEREFQRTREKFMTELENGIDFAISRIRGTTTMDNAPEASQDER